MWPLMELKQKMGRPVSSSTAKPTMLPDGKPPSGPRQPDRRQACEALLLRGDRPDLLGPGHAHAVRLVVPVASCFFAVSGRPRPSFTWWPGRRCGFFFSSSSSNLVPSRRPSPRTRGARAGPAATRATGRRRPPPPMRMSALVRAMLWPRPQELSDPRSCHRILPPRARPSRSSFCVLVVFLQPCGRRLVARRGDVGRGGGGGGVGGLRHVREDGAGGAARGEARGGGPLRGAGGGVRRGGPRRARRRRGDSKESAGAARAPHPPAPNLGYLGLGKLSARPRSAQR